jgi:hypothetical protein
MTKYELEVKMLVDSWVYGGIADLIKQMPKGILGVNVLSIKKQEGAWDSSCLPFVMDGLSAQSSIAGEDSTQVQVLTKKEQDKLDFVEKELKKQNEGKDVGQVGYKTLLKAFTKETGILSWIIEIEDAPLGNTTSMEFDTVDKLYSYIFNQRMWSL